VIRVDNLLFTYPGGAEPALRGVDFAVDKGEIFGFLGPSGAGKSTTQKILIGLLKEFQGQVEVLGKDLRGWGSDLYEQVGVSFELPNHYQKLTGLENLNLFRSLYSGAVADPMDLLTLVGLEGDANTRVSAYSKGMQMRLNVVRALLHDPDLLFLDEPTAGLDPVNGRKIKEIIRDKKSQGKTVFLTTHDMNVADDLCDRVAFIVDGSINLIDSPRNLKLQHGRHFVRVEYRLDGATRQADFPLDDLSEDREFLDLIRDQEVETIHTQEATLEDIFIRATGRSLA
jgi:fluoroquinolone transport system ATP-binding protein